MQWDAAVDGFVTGMKIAGRSPHTITNYASDLAQARAYWTQQRNRHTLLQDLRALTADDVANWLQYLRNQVSPRTFLRRRSSLKTFLAYAVEQQWIDQSPYPVSQVLKEHDAMPTPQIVYLTPEQVPTFMTAVSRGMKQDRPWVRARDVALMWVLLTTGMRISEACRVTLAQMTELKETGKITVTGKGNKTRTLSVPQAIGPYLDAYQAQRPKTPLAVFFVSQRQIPATQSFPVTPLTPQVVQRRMQRYAARSGLHLHLTPHKLRHTYATNLLQSGADIRTVQEALGHTHVTTTTIYTHVAKKAQAEAVNRLPYLPSPHPASEPAESSE